jgi:uncharacterized membrane protein YccC
MAAAARARAALRGWRARPYDGIGSAVKASVSAVLAWLLAQSLVSSGSDFYAPLVAVATVQTTVASTLRDGVQRLTGVTLGLALGYAELRLLGQVSWWSLGVTLFVATLLSRWHRLGAQGVQIPIAALLMLLFASRPTAYAESLLAEGVIGAAVATLVNLLVVPPLYVRTGEHAMARLRGELGDALDRMSSDVGAHNWPPERPQWNRDIQALTAALDAAREAVDHGSDSVRLNFRARRVRHLPRTYGEALVALEHVVVSVRETARILDASASDDVGALRLGASFRLQFASLLRQLAGAVSSYGGPAGGPGVAGEQRPVDQAHEQLSRLQHQLLGQSPSDAPSLLAEGALLAELEQVLHELRRAQSHRRELSGWS